MDSQKICYVITSFLSVCFENDNFGDVRSEGNMAGFYEDQVRLFRLFTILHFVGKSFLNLFGFTSVVKKYLSVFPDLCDVEVPLAEYFLIVLQIDFRYDGSTSTASSRSIRVESSRFDNISNPLRNYSRNVFKVSRKSISGMTGQHQL